MSRNTCALLDVTEFHQVHVHITSVEY